MRRRTDRPNRSVGRVAPAAGFHAWPRRGSACPAGRSGPRLGTRFRLACLGRGLEAAPQPSRRSFFKSLLGFVVSLRMAGPYREPAVAELGQNLANRTFVPVSYTHL